MFKTGLMGGIILLAFQFSYAAVKTEVVEYKDGKEVMQGFVAYDDTVKGPRPTILIIHQWMGITDHEREYAKKLAEQGYLAFAVDIYGKGKRPQNRAEAAQFAETYRGDRKLFRQRAKAAYKFIQKDKRADKKQMIVLGFCFGGTGALELARSGAPLIGVISFHGGLSSPTPQDAKNIKAPVLILHGAADPTIKPEEIQGFMKEMNDAGVDYQFISYSQAVHGFTQEGAGSDPSTGVAYNEKGARRSWQALTTFLNEIAPVTGP